MVIQKLGAAFKKMSQRSLWRGDRSQSEMIENHGIFGMRNNMLRDTPSYKKDGIGLGGSNMKMVSSSTAAGNAAGNNNTNTKVKTSVSQTKSKTSLGGSILDSLKF